jgi:hypothetical protein
LPFRYRHPSTVPVRDADAPAAPQPTGRESGGLHSPDGRPWSGVERVEADVIRVTTLTALFVQANEIRCPHIVRSSSVPVQKDIGPWQVEGDLVETDALKAYAVSERLIIADEVRAMVIKKLTKPHRWAGAGGSSPVRKSGHAHEGVRGSERGGPGFLRALPGCHSADDGEPVEAAWRSARVPPSPPITPPGGRGSCWEAPRSGRCSSLGGTVRHFLGGDRVAPSTWSRHESSWFGCRPRPYRQRVRNAWCGSLR